MVGEGSVVGMSDITRLGYKGEHPHASQTTQRSSLQDPSAMHRREDNVIILKQCLMQGRDGRADMTLGIIGPNSASSPIREILIVLRYLKMGFSLCV